MRSLRYPRLILERLGFPLALTQTLQVLASSCLPQQIFNFSSKLLTRFKKTAKEFASDAQTQKNYSQKANTFIRSLLRIERFDKTKRKYISNAIKKTTCETFKNYALKITVTHPVRLRAMRNTKKKT